MDLEGGFALWQVLVVGEIVRLRSDTGILDGTCDYVIFEFDRRTRCHGEEHIN
jgi:hypothetical protein